MSESTSHRRAKNQAAGTHGETEVTLSRNGRLDALTSGGGRATEVERSGQPQRLREAAQRLDSSGATQRVLQVPNQDMSKASEAMRDAGVSGTVKNMGRTRRRSVRPGSTPGA